MTPERWQQIERLYYAALERDANQHAAFLAEACAGDEELRREVESLLASNEQAGNFMTAPALEIAAKAVAEEQTQSLTGRQIDHYQTLALLGAGGMGEVYLAEDRRLGRKVALKLLPAEFTRNRERLLRFEQEARAASALNHPNIITIYEIGEVDGLHFIATEFIDGQTLRQRLMSAPLKLGEALEVATQVASALSAAHEAGIVHRDIKPENIMLRRDGYVKVLDFGLAKLIEPGPTGHTTIADSEAEPPKQFTTAAGQVLGTPRYMSPEQILGRQVDGRADTFSLGVVLYEMAAGRAPFEGATAGEMMAAILNHEPPPLQRYTREAPAELERIVSKALAKDCEERYQVVKDLLIDLKSLRLELELDAKLKRAGQSWQGAAPETDSSKQTQQAPVATQAMSSGGPLRSQIRRRRWSAVAALAALVLTAAAIVYFPRSSRAVDSLAILPLLNASGDPSAEYLSDGITENIINRLSQLSQLRVKARTEVFRYKGQEVDPRQVGRNLGVQAVMTGRMTLVGDSVSIQADLVNVADGTELWGEKYSRKLSDIQALQEELAKQISEKLRLKLTGEEQRLLTKRYTENSEAHLLYTHGRYRWDKRGEGVKRAIEDFTRAVRLDPNFAPAYVGLADSYNLLGYYGELPPAEAYQQSLEAAQRALKIDDSLAEAHASLADIKYLYQWDWPGAEREFKRAIELNPRYATAHQWYSQYLAAVGRLDESLEAIKRAQELEPKSPAIYGDLGWPYYFQRRYDQAIAHFQQVIELEPSFAHAHSWLGLAYAQKQLYEKAIAEAQAGAELLKDNPFTLMILGYAYAASGRRSQARAVLDQMEELAKRRYVSPAFIAVIYAGLGEQEKFFAWGEKAYRERSPLLAQRIKQDPLLDPFRSEPRFQDMLRRIGLSP